MDNIYVVTFGWDNDSVGYFKSKNEAEEYCRLMNVNANDEDGYYCLEEFKLLDLEEEKEKIRNYYVIRIKLKVKDGVVIWDIDNITAKTTQGEICSHNVYKNMDSTVGIIMPVETDNKRDAIKSLRILISEIQNKYYDTESLEDAVSAVFN